MYAVEKTGIGPFSVRMFFSLLAGYPLALGYEILTYYQVKSKKNYLIAIKHYYCIIFGMYLVYFGAGTLGWIHTLFPAIVSYLIVFFGRQVKVPAATDDLIPKLVFAWAMAYLCMR
jgi:hypothetical protein